jgi:Cu-Zn family superoxide dismutase
MKRPSTSSLLVISLFVAGCGGSSQEPAMPEAAPPEASAPTPPTEAAVAPEAPAAEPAKAEPEKAAAAPKSLTAALEPKSNSKLTGSVTLTEVDGGVRVQLAVAGVKPGKHGAHVHEKGDCSAPDGASAGGHFNPGGHPHALPAADPRHLGDLGNIEVGADGKGELDITVKGATLEDGKPESYVGKAIIVHEKTDDGGQPTGNAGGRIGCAVLKGS